MIHRAGSSNELIFFSVAKLLKSAVYDNSLTVLTKYRNFLRIIFMYKKEPVTLKTVMGGIILARTAI